MPHYVYLVPILGVIGMFFIPGAIVITFFILRHRQRMEMLRQGIYPESDMPSYPKRNPLLLGLLFIGLGIAFAANNDYDLRMLGFLFLGAGIALLVYWNLTAPDRERQMRFYEEWMAAKIKEMENSPAAMSSGVENAGKKEEKPRDTDSL